MLPKLVQSASGKSYDSSSPQGKMIVNSPNYKNPFDKKSSALAPMDPAGSGLAAAGEASPMSPMESAMAVFQSMADSLESIKESAISLVMASEGDARGDALADANVTDPEDPNYVPPVDPEGDGDEDKPSRMPSLKKLGLTLLIAGVIFFAEKLKPILAKVLEGFKFIYEILKTSFLAVFDYVKEFFADPVGTLKKSFAALGEGIVSLGSWIWENAIKPAWNWIKGLFGFGDKEEKEAEGTEGGWSVSGLVTGVFTSIKEWFGKLFKFDSTSDIITSLVNVITFVPNLLKDLITGATEWLLGLFGFDDAAKKLANATDWTFGSLITGAFKAVKDWFVGLFTWGKETGTTEAGDWSLFKFITGVWTNVKTWFTNLFSWASEEKEGDSWLVGTVKGVVTSVKEWFKKLFSFDSKSDTITSLINVITFVPNLLKDLITGATEWLLGLFGFDDAAKKVANATDWTFGSLISGAFIAVKDWFAGIFSFSADETEKDPSYKPFSIISTVVDAIAGIGAYLKKVFTFDPSKITDGLMDFGGFMKAISFASTAYLKTLLNPFTKGSNADAAQLAYETTFNEIMGGGGSSADIEPVPTTKTQELVDETDQFTRGQGQGTTFIQDFSQKSDVKQQNGDVILGADLSADDSDPTEKVLGRVVRPGGFSDVRLKEDIKLVRKSPSDINIYEFKYIGEEGKYEGVMAQEVPWASSIADNGFLWVDYTKLDVDFVKLS